MLGCRASADASLLAWLGEHGAFALQASGACRPGLVHVASREYSLRCNWKIFADNYLVRHVCHHRLCMYVVLQGVAASFP